MSGGCETRPALKVGEACHSFRKVLVGGGSVRYRPDTLDVHKSVQNQRRGWFQVGRMKQRVGSLLVGMALVLGGSLGAAGIAQADGSAEAHWIGTTDNGTRVHGEVSASGTWSIKLVGNCAGGFWIRTDAVANVSKRYLKTDETCWWGVSRHWDEKTNAG